MNQATDILIGEMITRDLYDRTWWQTSPRPRRRRPERSRTRWSLRVVRGRERVATA